MRNRCRAFIAALAVSCVAASAAAAQPAARGYPDKPIRLIVPSPPGGGNDIMARIAGQRLNEALGEPVVIDNRPGAGGNIGTGLAVRAAADGYTLLLGSTNIGTMPYLTKPVFDPLKDFAPVSLIATAANLMLINPTVPAKSVQELIVLARGRPGVLNYASGSLGSSTHLAGELFKHMARADIVHVPFKGAGPGLISVIANQTQLMYSNPAAAGAHVRSGKLRALAVTSATRLKDFPELPTVAEDGLPGFEASTWWGILAPAGTPAAIVKTLNAILADSIAGPEVNRRIAALGAQPVGGSTAVLSQHIRNEVAKWSKLIREVGIRID